MVLFLCSIFSKSGKLIKEKVEGKNILFSNILIKLFCKKYKLFGTN